MQVVLTAEIFVATPSLFQNSIGGSLRKENIFGTIQRTAIKRASVPHLSAV
jgi:hypothetical protein